MDSRKVKFSAATVVDSFIRFRPLAVLRETTIPPVLGLGSAIEGISALRLHCTSNSLP
jgi:hypothetical protein